MGNLKKILKAREISSVLFVLALFLIVGIVNPDFLSSSNIILVLNGSVVFTILAVGIAFVIMTGEIDVSIGATLGLAAAISATLLRNGTPWVVAILAALAVGVAAGLVNGFGVTFIGVPSIIMTLGTNGIIRGLSYLYTDGKWVENVPFAFKSLAQASLWKVNWFYIGALLMAAAIYFIQMYTKRGRYIKAVGDNPAGATLVGIPVRATKMTAYVLCSVCASIAGLMYVARVGFVTPTAGNGYEMKAIAACVLGGISLAGGVGSMFGAAIGAVIISSISRLLVFLQLSSDYDNTITGILLIAIVVGDAVLQKRGNEKARRARLKARTDNVTPAKGGASE